MYRFDDMEVENCPNCKKKLTGILNTREMYQQAYTDFINVFKDEKSVGYCTNCGPTLFSKYSNDLKRKKEDLITSISKDIDVIPIVTAPAPANWDYQILEMVTAQSVTGTGMLSEISSSWADFLGGQADVLSNKLSNGENICKNKLRLSAAILGGNCIVATDIDYAEVGGGKGMLMVCMAGTAAILHNIHDVLAVDRERMDSLMSTAKELGTLNKIKIP